MSEKYGDVLVQMEALLQIARTRNLLGDKEGLCSPTTPPRFHGGGVVGEGAEGPGRGERAPIARGGGMRRSEEARVSEEAVRRKGGGGGPRKLGMG